MLSHYREARTAHHQPARGDYDTLRILTRSIAVILAAGTVACTANESVTPLENQVAVSFAREAAYSPWSAAIPVEQLAGTSMQFNTSALDGCPFVSPDGKQLFMASNRPNGMGGIDIWVASRKKTDGPWGEPVNVGAPVNSSANDFCPTMSRDGHTLFFVSNRVEAGACGGDDIYVSRLGGDGTFEQPQNLGCAVNSAGNEAGPFPLTEPGSGPVLYFSSTRAGGFSAESPGAITGDADIYRSEWHGGSYRPATLVPGLNTAASEIQPNLQRDGVEMYFASNRAGTPGTTGTLGGNDIFVATRASAHDDWRTPTNLGPNVNTATYDETRPSLSWDALTLYFGSNRPGEGMSDIYVTTRTSSR